MLDKLELKHSNADDFAHVASNASKNISSHHSADALPEYKRDNSRRDRSSSPNDFKPKHRRGAQTLSGEAFKLQVEEELSERIPLKTRESEHSRHSSADSELKAILANSPASPRTANATNTKTLTKKQVQLAINSIIGFEENDLPISLFKTHLRSGSDLFARKVQMRQLPSECAGEELLFKLYHDIFLDNIEESLVAQNVNMTDSSAIYQIITTAIKQKIIDEKDIFFDFLKSQKEFGSVRDEIIRVYAVAFEETIIELSGSFLEYKILADRLRVMLDVKADQGSRWTQINPFIANGLAAVPLSQVQINSNSNDDASYQAIQNFCLAFFSLASTILSYATRNLEANTKEWEEKYLRIHDLITQMYNRKILWFQLNANNNEEIIWDKTTEKFDFIQVVFMHSLMLLKQERYLQYDRIDEEFTLNMLGALLNRFLSRFIFPEIANYSKPKTLDDAENLANILARSYSKRLDELNFLSRKFIGIHPPSESSIRNYIINFFRFSDIEEKKNHPKLAFAKKPEDKDDEKKEDISEEKSLHLGRSHDRTIQQGGLQRKLGNSLERRRRSISPISPEQLLNSKLLPRRKKSDSNLEAVNKVEILREIRSKIINNYLHTAWYDGIANDEQHYNIMQSTADSILNHSKSQNLYWFYIPTALTANYISGLSLLGVISNSLNTLTYTALCMCFSIVSTFINNYILAPYLERIDDNIKRYNEFEETLKRLLSHEDILSLNDNVYSSKTLAAQASQRNLHSDTAMAAQNIFNTSALLQNINIITAATFWQLCNSLDSEINLFNQQQKASLAMNLYTTLCQSAINSNSELKSFFANMSKEQATSAGKAIADALIADGTVVRCKINAICNILPCCKQTKYYLKITDINKDGFVDALRQQASNNNQEGKIAI